MPAATRPKREYSRRIRIAAQGRNSPSISQYCGSLSVNATEAPVKGTGWGGGISTSPDGPPR